MDQLILEAAAHDGPVGANRCVRPQPGQTHQSAPTTQAEPVMRVSRYLIRYWARHLGPEGLCLVIAARQMAYEQRAEDEARFQATRGELAARAAISERTVGRRLQRHAAVGAFLQQREKALLHEKGEYEVRLHDPLAPEHVRGLVAYLREETCEVFPQRRRAVQRALQALLAMSPARARRVLERADPHLNPLPHRERAGVRVHEIVSALGVGTERMLCEKVERHLIEPERVVLIRHTFWEKWLPRLGPRRCGLLLNLRSRCFYDERSGELRDTCRESYRRLAVELGLSHRQLERLLAEVRDCRGEPMCSPCGGGSRTPPTLLRRFLQIVEPGLGRRLALFRVLMRDPLPDAASDEASPPEVGAIHESPPPSAPVNDDVEAGQSRHSGSLRGVKWRHPGGAKTKHYNTEHFTVPGEVAPSFSLEGNNAEEAAWQPMAEATWQAILRVLACQLSVGVYREVAPALEPLGLAEGEPPALAMRAKTMPMAERRQRGYGRAQVRGP